MGLQFLPCARTRNIQRPGRWSGVFCVVSSGAGSAGLWCIHGGAGTLLPEVQCDLWILCLLKQGLASPKRWDRVCTAKQSGKRNCSATDRETAETCIDEMDG